MRTRAKFAVGTTAVALAVSVGGGVAAMAATNAPQQAHLSAKSAVRTAAAASFDTSTEAKFTAITPCRIVDTRVAGGAIAKGSTRSFVVASLSLTSQGGNAAGCGIPTSAVAIQANVVAVGATGSGYLKVYPFGATVPAASFLNFHDSRAVANGGTITVDTGAAQHFTVLASQATNVVIDVSGYFTQPMWAHVERDGTLAAGSRVSLVSGNGGGSYVVDFDRDVSNCAYAVTPFHGDAGVFDAEPADNDPDGVALNFLDSQRNETIAEFYLTVTC